jgi:CHAD domain-containing protein
MASSATQFARAGIGYWMREVLKQCGKVAEGFPCDAVHDLRTCLRRCRSIADGMMVLDPDPAWKRMKRAGRELFRGLGSLRDTHILQEWIARIAPQDGHAAPLLLAMVRSQERELMAIAATALEGFDRGQWELWAKALPARAARIPLDSPVFAEVALERLEQARRLHSVALRNRTNVAFHNLRIGIKRFRYTIENFLPALYEGWGPDLKELQDILGDVHDLDVLWQVALRLKVVNDSATRKQWRSRIDHERQQRLEQYRTKMVGRCSLWRIWRAELPEDDRLRELGLRRLEIWASFLDPDLSHANHVADLAMQLCDGLPVDALPAEKREPARYILRAAALLHDVGRSRKNSGHHKASAHLILKLTPPLGWTLDELRTAALVARYHRGALPGESQQRFAGLPQSKKQLVQYLAGILRLACACDREHDRQIARVAVEDAVPLLTVRAEGYRDSSPLARHIASARHLLEMACHRPVYVVPFDGEGHAA